MKLFKCSVTQFVGVPISEVPQIVTALTQVGYERKKIFVIKITRKMVTITAKM